MKRFAASTIVLLTAGSTLLQPVLAADQLAASPAATPAAATGGADSPVAPTAAPLDIALGQDGWLSGQLVDHQGNPLAGWPVVIAQENFEVANVVTDAQGHFAVKGLRGGFYMVSGGDENRPCRLWADGSAPPTSAKGLQLCGGNADTLRGQHFRARNFFTSPWFIGGAIGGAIALPLALHNRQPAS